MPVHKKKEIDLGQQTRFLRKVQFFEDFDDNELKQFLSVSKWRKVPANTLIIEEGTTERIFYILVKGQVSIFKTLAEGKILELTTLATGACFGEMALVSENKRTAGVKATTDSYLLMVDPTIVSTSSVFLQLKFYKKFCEILVTRLDLANKRMASQGAPAKPVKSAPLVSPPREKITIPVSDQASPLPEAAQPAREAKQPLSLPPMPEMKGRVAQASLKPRLQNDKCLAINPLVAEPLTRLLGHSGDHSRHLADLVVFDPVLSAKVLQAANSPFYRRSCPVLSVTHAMIIIGAQNAQKTVMEAIEASQGLQQPFSGYPLLIKQFWQHGIIVGRIAELLKEVVRVEVAADIYTAGLFHDLGMLALDLREPHFYPQLLEPESELALKLERNETDYIGTSHGMAGKWLGEYLGLPPVYLEVMRLHHQPEKAGSDFALPVALVHLADLFAAERGFCLGRRKIDSKPLESFAWVLIREQHKPFQEVDLFEFLICFNEELDKNWNDIISDSRAGGSPAF